MKQYYNKTIDKEVQDWLNSDSKNHIQESVKEYVKGLSTVDRRIVYLAVKHGINLACEMFGVKRRTLYYKIRDLFINYKKPEQYIYDDFNVVFGDAVVIDYDSIPGWSDRSDN